MNIQNIIFDNGGVLSNPRTGDWYITTNFWNIIDLNKETNTNIIKEIMKKCRYILTQEPKTELEEYNMFTEFYYQVLKEINYNNLSKEIARQLANDCVYNDEKYLFFDDVDTELQRLSEKYDLYMISDAWASTFRVLDNRNISKYFKSIMVSAIESRTKMEGLFEIFIEKNKNIIPQDSIFIDDRKDILDKASQYGFNVLLMDRNSECIDYTYKVIHRLDEIEKIINNFRNS